MEHTALPWTADGLHVKGPVKVHICATEQEIYFHNSFYIGNSWGSREQRIVDAAFIVKAVNSHAKLVAALKAMLTDEALSKLIEDIGEDPDWMKVAREALREAGGEL